MVGGPRDQSRRGCVSTHVPHPTPDSFTPTLMCHGVPWTPTGMTRSVLNVCSEDDRSREAVSVSSMHQDEGEGKQRPHRRLPKYNQGRDECCQQVFVGLKWGARARECADARE